MPPPWPRSAPGIARASRLPFVFASVMRRVDDPGADAASDGVHRARVHLTSVDEADRRAIESLLTRV